MFDLKYQIETALDHPLEPGAGLSLILEGWAFCPQFDIRQLWVYFDGRRIPVVERGIARQDILVAYQSGNPKWDVRALRSGYWVALPVAAAPQDRLAGLYLIAELSNGEVLTTPRLDVLVKASPRPRIHLQAPLPDNPRVAICMATYNPAEAVFRRQIDSIRAQDHTNWVCLIQDDWSSRTGIDVIRRVIGDDPRFILERNPRNLGFYFNFERVLQRVPADCHLVALSDQDDAWFPDKLSTLIAAFTTPDTTMTYSDMRIVDGEGKVLSNTYWATRRNNYTDLETMFFANTITGAATCFKAALLPILLPFPPKRGIMYHDWWLGLVALASGRIGYVDRPLYDYFQHGGNVVGWSHIGRVASVKKFLREGYYRKELAHAARTIYNTDCKFLASTLQTLQLRIAEPTDETALRRLSGLTRHPLRTMVEQSLRAIVLKRASQNREKNILMAHAVMRLLNLFFARTHREILQKFGSREEAAGHEPSAPTRSVIPVETFEIKCKPLALDIRRDETPRVNIFLATIDFKYFFGGYIGMFQLAKHIANAGFKTRFLLHEPTDFQPAEWRRQIQKYKGLEDIFDLVEVEYRFDRTIPLKVSPHDRFVATSCWSAWLADAAARQVNARPFVFMIQEYEPYFVPHGSYYALSHAAYDLNLYGLFSTEILRDFFRQKRFGIYRDGVEAGDRRSTAFHNAVLKFNVTPARLRERLPGSAKRKMLFYCRPEPHAQRNMFELGILALRKAINDGALDPAHWDFFGIGTVGQQFVIPLPKGAEMVALPKMSLEEYAEYLPDFDLGMSLMYTPHPSLVPLEMAAAGLLSVTNSCENKTADVLRQISTNFEVGEASIDSLADALKRAEARVPDIDDRVRGASIRWPHTWDEAFAPSVIEPLLAELRAGFPAAR